MSLTIRAVGDILFAPTPPPWKNPQFKRLADWLQAADLAFANMESPLVEEGFPIPKIDVARADLAMAEELRKMGLSMVSVANNHLMDYGVLGMKSTLTALRRAGVAFAGAGPDLEAAFAPTFVPTEEGRVALIACHLFYKFGWDRYLHDVRATDHQAGVAAIMGDRVRIGLGRSVIAPHDQYLECLLQAIPKAHQDADLVVVSMHTHWGPEDISEITDGRRLITHEAIEAGADLILGHGPHTINGIECYKGRFIVHSMGNFFFHIPAAMGEMVPESRPFLQRMMDEERFWLGMGVEAVFSGTQSPPHLKIIPVEVSRKGKLLGMPLWGDSEASRKIFELFEPQCKALGTRAVLEADGTITLRS